MILSVMYVMNAQSLLAVFHYFEALDTDTGKLKEMEINADKDSFHHIAIKSGFECQDSHLLADKFMDSNLALM